MVEKLENALVEKKAAEMDFEPVARLVVTRVLGLVFGSADQTDDLMVVLMVLDWAYLQAAVWEND